MPPSKPEGGATDGARAPGAEAAEDDLDEDIAAIMQEVGEPGSPPPSAAPEKRDLSGQEIIYRVTGEGLVIEIDGLHLRPKAKAVARKNGSFDVQFEIEARSFDGRLYWLQTASEGPLSIAGRIEKKSGERERFSDRRSGKEEELVSDGSPVTFRQKWPGKGQPKLWRGQKVRLEVGLWGMRVEQSRERPVRRLFVVEMLATRGPTPVISPPSVDWGS